MIDFSRVTIPSETAEENLVRIKAYCEGGLHYWEQHRPLPDYQQGVETGLKMVLSYIKKLEKGIDSK